LFVIVYLVSETGRYFDVLRDCMLCVLVERSIWRGSKKPQDRAGFKWVV